MLAHKCVNCLHPYCEISPKKHTWYLVRLSKAGSKLHENPMWVATWTCHSCDVTAHLSVDDKIEMLLTEAQFRRPCITPVFEWEHK